MSSDLRITLSLLGFALLFAGGAWWQVFRRHKGDWLGGAALMTAVTMGIGAFIILGVLL